MYLHKTICELKESMSNIPIKIYRQVADLRHNDLTMRTFDDVRSAHWTANLEVTNYSQSRRVVSPYPSMACSWKINLVPGLSLQ